MIGRCPHNISLDYWCDECERENYNIWDSLIDEAWREGASNQVDRIIEDLEDNND